MMQCSAVLQLSMALRGAVLAASISLLLFSAASGCRRPAAPPAGSSDSAEAAPHREGVAPAEPRKSALPAADPPVADAGALEIIKWPPKFGERQLRASIEQAINYLVRTTDEHGKFAYIVNTHPEVPATDEYNVVRHAGTMYGLGMYLERYEQDADAVRAALLRQGAFLRKQIKPVEGRQDMRAIWAEPDSTGREGPRRHCPRLLHRGRGQ